jgi:hypothetical protein
MHSSLDEHLYEINYTRNRFYGKILKFRNFHGTIAGKKSETSNFCQF